MEQEHRKFIIHASNKNAFEEKVTKLNSKAHKLGLEFYQYFYDKSYEENNENYLPVYISGPLLVKADGWEFIASLTHLTNEDCLIFPISNKSMPDIYKTSGSACEHCNQNRKRNQTYILYNESKDKYMQVGSSCLKDFIDGFNIDSIDKNLDFVSKTYETLNEFKNKNTGEPTFNLPVFIAKTIVEIDRNGWVAKSKSDGESRHPTCLNVINDYDNLTYTNDQLDKALDIIRYVENLPEEKTRDNSYLTNIQTIAKLNFVQYRTIGLASSMVSVYNFNNKPKQENNSKFVGEIKERKIFNLSFKRGTSYGTDYGMTNIYTFEDKDSNVFVWRTTTYNEFEKDKEYKIKGTVKLHNVYKKINQTELSRCEVIKI